MTYSGKYPCKNPSKYRGDIHDIVFRSMWERCVFRFCDENLDVISWASESVIVPYICKTDNKPHRYFVDLQLTLKNGQTYLIEIKPEKETVPPKVPSRKTPRYVREVLTYVKNTSKWNAAEKYANERGFRFEIWTEKTLKKLGIKLLT